MVPSLGKNMIGAKKELHSTSQIMGQTLMLKEK